MTALFSLDMKFHGCARVSTNMNLPEARGFSVEVVCFPMPVWDPSGYSSLLSLSKQVQLGDR